MIGVKDEELTRLEGILGQIELDKQKKRAPSPNEEFLAETLLKIEWEAMTRFRSLLTQLGDEGKCKGCAATVFWVQHRNGRRAPYTPEGLNHFIDCPQAARFKKTKTDG